MKKIFIMFSMMISILLLTQSFAVNASIVSDQTDLQNEIRVQSVLLSKFNDLYSKGHGNKLFDEAFGGAFFENGYLYINIVQGLESRFVTSFDLDIDVRLRPVDYSIKTLEQEKIKIDNMGYELFLTETSIDDKSNSIVIHTASSSQEVYEKITSIVRVNNIRVIYEKPLSSYATRYTTNGVWYDITGDVIPECTVGFAAYNENGDPGFVTAGHCVALTGATYNSDVDYYYDGAWRHAGDVFDWRFSNTNADAAFIKLRDPLIGETWLPTRKFMNNQTYVGVDAVAINPFTGTPYLVAGTAVQFYGAFNEDGSANYSVDYGYILETNVTEWIGSYVHYDQVKTNISIHQGDSGGALTYWLYAGSATAYLMVMGVASSRGLEDRSGDNIQDDPYSIFSTVDNIYSQLDLSTYY